MSPRPRQVDANHYRIASVLRQVGAFVLDLHTLPGALDLLVGYRGVLVILEIKSDPAISHRRGARRFTPAETETIRQLEAVGAPVFVVEDEDEALAAIGAVSKT